MSIIFKKYKALFGGIIFLSILMSIANVAAAKILEQILNSVTALDWESFSRMVLGVPVYLVAVGAILMLQDFSTKKFISRVVRDLRADAYQGIFSRDPENFQAVNTAEYISALSNDVKTVEENVLVPLMQSIQYGFVFIATVIALLFYSPLIAGLMFICLVAMYLVPALLGKAIGTRQERLSKKFAKFTVGLKDQLSGYDVIRSFQLMGRVQGDFETQNEELMEAKFSVDKMVSISQGAASTLAMATQLLIMLVSGYLVLKGQMTAGVLLALLELSGTFVQPVAVILQNIPQIQGAQPILERIRELSETKPSAFNGDQSLSFEEQISLQEVSFGYKQDQVILNKASITFDKNKKYAIIGASGSGKSTLMKLLCAGYGGYDGAITVDGDEIRRIRLDELLAQISVIHQNVYMFDESIKDNISLHRNYSKEEWEEVLETSGVGNFLEQMEAGLDTAVGENGIHLSGGQRQRIAVARALIQKKPVLVLDEGTSAVDAKTAFEIETALLEKPDITMIAITHNLNPELLRRYDQIVFVEDGQIVGAAGYDELLQTNLRFQEYRG